LILTYIKYILKYIKIIKNVFYSPLYKFFYKNCFYDMFFYLLTKHNKCIIDMNFLPID
jgi:hypothetical protein